MTHSQPRKVIVVLSAGRAGTSLLMNVLGRLGMTLSQDMVPGNYANPEGHFEDREIVDIHREFLASLGAHPYLPLPDGWQGGEEESTARKKLRNVLEKRLQAPPTIWGFKDPRTNAFLPTWFRLFNSEKLRPVFILAVRDPRATVSSYVKQYRDNPSLAELAYLVRNTEALHHTAADCYIAHYEDWFTRGEEMAGELLRYTGLDAFFTGSVSEAFQNVVKANLNRSAYEEYEIQNEYVSRLYAVLQKCRGADFDRAALMDTVKECRRAMNGFRGWAQLAVGASSKKNEVESAGDAKKLGAESEEKNARIARLEADLEKSVLLSNDYLKQVKDLDDEISHLRIRISTMSQAAPQDANLKRQLAQSRRDLDRLCQSSSYRLGNMLIKAVKKPGRNTVLLPYRLMKMAYRALKRKKK